ncbi:MAG: hypothetical protein ACUVRD_01855 [Bacteroidia bacterium]
MKNVAIVFGLVSLLQAQKPTSGTVTSEVQLQGAINNITTTPIGGFRVRYFLGDNLAARVGLNLTSLSQTQKDYENPDGTGGKGEYKASYFAFRLAPGVEYHLEGGEKLSTFVGTQIIFQSRSAKETATNYNPSSGRYINNFSETVTGEATIDNNTYYKGTDFGFGIYTGFDWYFTEKVYLGIELGLNLLSSSNSDITTETSSGGITTKTITAGSKGSNLDVQSIGGLRLGYQF